MKVKEDNRNTISNILLRLYVIAVCSFLTLFFGLFTITGNLQGMIFAICFLIMILIIKKRKHFLGDTSNLKVSSIIFLTVFIFRYIYCDFVNPFIGQVSDFKVVLNEAESGIFTDNLNYYRIYVHKLIYPFILHFFNIRSQSGILVFQCVIVASCAVVLYWIGSRIVNQKVGILSSIIYMLWPAQMVYTQIITEEHMAALLTSLIIFIIICVCDRITETVSLKEKNSKRAILGSCVVGCLSGLCAFFKDWASVIIVAVVICSIYLIAQYNKIQKILLFICVCCILFFRTVTEDGIMLFAEEKLQVNANNSVIVVQMFATLDPNSSGNYNPELNDEYRQILIDNDFDFAKANSIAMNILKEKIQKDYKKLPALLLRKGKSAYSNDSQMFSWAQKSVISDTYKDQFSWFYLLLRYIDNVYYTGIILCLLVSAYCVRNKYNFFILLCILGGGMAGLLVEGQGRYKYSIEPIWCISAAYGMYFLCKLLINMLFQKIRRNHGDS